MQRISRFRMIVFIVIILAMIGVFSLRLYKTQAAVTEESLVAADADSMTYQSTVERARQYSGPQRQRAGLQPREL